MTWRAYILPIMVAVLVFFVTAPSPYSHAYADAADTVNGTPAAGDVKTVDENNNVISCKDMEEAKGGVLLGRIMPCIVRTIENSTIKFSTKMVDMFRPLLYTFLTLVVVLFGVRVVQGEPEIHKHGILLLLKVVIVVTILDNIPTYFVPQTYKIMIESQKIITGTISSSSFQCEKIAHPGAPPEPYGDENTLRLWSMMDCVMGKIYGYTTGKSTDPGGAAKPNMVLMASLFGLLGGFFFGGAWAIVIFFGMLGVLVSIFMLVIRTAVAFLTGYLTVCLMLIISPLMTPLVFMRVTQQYSEGIWKNILAAFILPIMVIAYAMFALLMYDKMLFAPDSIVQRLFQYDQIKEAYENPRKACDRNVSNNATEIRFDGTAAKSDIQKQFLSPFLQNTIVPTLSGANDICTRAQIPVFNTNNVDKLNEGRKGFETLFYELLNLIILGYLIHLGFGMLMDVVRMVSGAGAALTGFGASTQNEFKFAQAARDARDKAIIAYRDGDGKDSQGAQFLERTPTAANASLSAFFSGIRRQ